MARTRKSRPKPKAARAKPARKRPKAARKAASRKAAGRPPSGTAAGDPLEGFVEAAARVLALPLEPHWLADVKFNLAVTLRAAAFVADFALPDESEPAPIFKA